MRFVSVTGVIMIMLAFLMQAPWLHGVANAANFSIGVSGFNFDPADRTIQTGDTIDWSWNTAEEHNVIFVGESDTSGAPATSDTYSRTFNAAGDFNYYCEIHGTPGGGGMAGTITVQAASTNTPTTTPGQGTATRTATRTPTRTPSPVATTTGTPQATATIVASTPVPGTTNVPTVIVHVDPGAPGGGSGGAITAPSTGSGSGDAFAVAPWWVSIALAVAGAAMVGGAIVAGRRTR